MNWHTRRLFIVNWDTFIRAFLNYMILLGCGALITACAPAKDVTSPAATVAFPELGAAPEQLKVIVDTDMGADDIMALLYLLQHPHVEVLAITVSGTGLVHCEPGVRNVQHLLTITQQLDVPVACGSEKPLRGEHAFPDSYRSLADGFFGMQADQNTGVPASPTATELLLATIIDDPNNTFLLTLGPLTNVAATLEEAPDLADELAGITMMGGAVDVPGNIAAEGVPIDNQVAEWNFYADPYAARVVFESGAPLTLVPLDATNQVPIEIKFFEQLQLNQHSPAATFTYDLLEENNYMLNGGWYFWDTLAAVIASGAKVAEFETRTLCLIDAEGQESGRTKLCEDGARVQVAEGVERTKFEETFLSVLNGVSREQLTSPVTRTESPTGTLLWKYEFGFADHDIYQFYVFPPSIIGDQIYFPALDADFHALDLQTGEPLWELAVDGDVQSFWAGNDEGIFLGSTEGYLYAIDRLTGQEKWRVMINEPVERPDNPHWITPVAVGDIIYTGSRAGVLFAVDAHSGEEQWRLETDGRTDYTPLAISDEAILVSSDAGVFYAVAFETGVELWRFETEQGILFPKVVDGVVYLSGRNIYALDEETGDELWRFGIEGEGFGNMLLYEEGVLIKDSDGFLLALDLDPGQELWRREFTSCVPFEPQASGDMFFLANEEGILHALDLDTGQTLWAFGTRDRICTAISVDENLVYAGSSDSSLYALEKETGKLVWQYQTGGVIFSQPLVANGVVYFMSGDGNFYAVSGPQ